MLFLSFFLLLTNLSALTLALDYPFTPDGKVKQKGTRGNDVSYNFVIKNKANNTYFHPGMKMTQLARPEADVAIARAKALNATRTTHDAATTVDKAKREDLGASAGVYACDGRNWSGRCSYTVSTGGRCHDFDSGYNEHSAFGPDGNVQCALYNMHGCSNLAIYDKYTWPGAGDLNWPGPWSGTPGFVPRSFRCRWCYGCFYGKAPHWIQSAWDYQT